MKLLSGTFMTNLFVKHLFMWNLCVELREPESSVENFSTTLETCKNGTFIWNLVEPELLTVQPLCGTLWNLNFYKWNLYVEPPGTNWAFKNGTFMWNLSEPELLRMEPLCGTARNFAEPGEGFGRLPQTTPKLYWKNPKPSRLLGKNSI